MNTDTIEICEAAKSTTIPASNFKATLLSQHFIVVPTPLLSLPNHNEEPHQQTEKLLSSSSSLDLPSTFANDITSSDSNVLHEAVMKKFNRTSSGKIYEKDLKDIFAMLIISLQLPKSPSSSSSSSKSKGASSLPLCKIRPIALSKKYPYSFHLLTAIERMTHLRVEIDSSSTVTCLSYSFRPEIALTLINQFYKAKLLHSPADRTRAEPKHNVWLQPTAKGLAVVQSFCEKVGIKKLDMPDILLQNSYNSMQLFYFDRDQVTDKIIYSKSLIHLLFARLLGPYPNVWSPLNKPDPITCVTDRGEFIFGKSTGEFSQMNNRGNFNKHSACVSLSKPADPFRFLEYQKKTLKLSQSFGGGPSVSNISGMSPYHHRYFLNPESDSHMQHYVSSVGVRLHKEKNFDSTKVSMLLAYRISGKAITQWLMDCTDIVRPKHAIVIANLFLSQKLIKAFNPGESSLQFHKEQYYRLDDKGVALCMWSKVGTKSDHNPLCKQNPFSPKVSLDTIMQDPGLKFQFKCHLENEFCLENFDAYCQLQAFQDNVKLWNDLMCVGGHEGGNDVLNKQAMQHQTSSRDKCMSIAYQIYNTYIVHDSPSMLNIDYSLRLQVVKLLTRISNEETNHRSDLKTYMQTPTDEFSHEQIDTTKEHLNSTENINLDQVLKELTYLFNEISAHLYKMMQVDSLPKFLNSLDKI